MGGQPFKHAVQKGLKEGITEGKIVKKFCLIKLCVKDAGVTIKLEIKEGEKIAQQFGKEAGALVGTNLGTNIRDGK